MTVAFDQTSMLVRSRVVRRWAAVLALSLSATQFAPRAAVPQDPPSTDDLALDCRTALWKTTFDDASAAGLDPRAVVTSFDGQAVEREAEADVATLRGTEQYGRTKCEAYSNWIWSPSGITVWGGCRAEFEYEAR